MITFLRSWRTLCFCVLATAFGAVVLGRIVGSHQGHDVPVERDFLQPAPPASWGGPLGQVRGHLFGAFPVDARVVLSINGLDATRWSRVAAIRWDGAFDLGALPAGAYRVLAVGGDSMVSRLVQIRTDGLAYNMEQGADVELYALPCKRIDVAAVDRGTGAAISGATVAIGGVELARTSSDGHASVCVDPEMRWTAVGVRAPGYERWGDWYLGTETMRVALRRATPASAVVLDARGNPVVGAIVIADARLGCGNAGDGVLDSAITDAQGRFEVAVPIVARLLIYLGNRHWVEQMALSPGARDAIIRLETADLFKDAPSRAVSVVRGRVTCAGQPVADAIVDQLPNGSIEDQTRSRADGSFALVLHETNLGFVHVVDRARGINTRRGISSQPAILVDNVDVEVSCSSL